MIRLGAARLDGLGRRGTHRRGAARQEWHGASRFARARQAGSGIARDGMSWPGNAWRGRLGELGFDVNGLAGMEWRDVAGWGTAGLGYGVAGGARLERARREVDRPERLDA